VTGDPVRAWQRRMDRMMCEPTRTLVELVNDALLILSIRDKEGRSPSELGEALGAAGEQHPGFGEVRRMVADRHSVIREHTP
jgi:hypothetical protein